jgi:hypothetical protein
VTSLVDLGRPLNLDRARYRVMGARAGYGSERKLDAGKVRIGLSPCPQALCQKQKRNRTSAKSVRGRH